MLLNTVDGINDLFKTEIPRPYIVLIVGPPGTLKSGLTCNIMAEHIRQSGEFGVYINLEQGTELHLRNMRSLGIDVPSNLFISDYSDFRKKFEFEAPNLDFLEMLMRMIAFFKENEGDRFTMLALDSLGALYSIIRPNKDLRVRMYQFFRYLREMGLISFIIMEKPIFHEKYQTAGGEEFLADGIIEMGMLETEYKHEVFLYIQVIKMRAMGHSRAKHHIYVKKDGLHILGPVFI